jgi:CheY-like chemotaxis protein
MPDSKMKLLVVDDSDESTLALIAALPGRHYAVTCADSAEAALRLLGKETFSLVLLDLALPDAAGLAVAASIRASHPATPILFLCSADLGDGAVRKGFHLGNIDFIRKPASKEALRAKVELFALLQRQEQEIQEKDRLLAQASRELSSRSEELDRLKQDSLGTLASRRLFLARLSHEIRTPMTGLLGMIDFTLDSDLKPDQENQLLIARRAGKALVKVINDLLEAGQPHPAAAPQGSAPPAPCGTAATALSVLIAEDDPTIMGLMSMLTARAGHRVLMARDGKEALSVWERERPDLVLMDVQMPELDGLEATRIIRDREKELGGQVPIYGMTAFVMEEDIKDCLEAGMTGHIGKPINFPAVLAVLNRHQAAETRRGAQGGPEGLNSCGTKKRGEHKARP